MSIWSTIFNIGSSLLGGLGGGGGDTGGYTPSVDPSSVLDPSVTNLNPGDYSLPSLGPLTYDPSGSLGGDAGTLLDGITVNGPSGGGGYPSVDPSQVLNTPGTNLTPSDYTFPNPGPLLGPDQPYVDPSQVLKNVATGLTPGDATPPTLPPGTVPAGTLPGAPPPAAPGAPASPATPAAPPTSPTTNLMQLLSELGLGAGVLSSGSGGLGPNADKLQAQADSNSALVNNTILPTALANQQGSVNDQALSSIQRALEQKQASIRQTYQQMGMSGSTMETQDLNAAKDASTQEVFAVAQQMATTGLATASQITGADNAIYQELMQAQIDKDQQLQDALAAFAGAVAK